MIILLLIGLFVIIEWVGRREQFAIEKPFFRHGVLKWIESYIWIFIILIFGNFQNNPFIYFQF